jgi:hypothetical protein
LGSPQSIAHHRGDFAGCWSATRLTDADAGGTALTAKAPVTIGANSDAIAPVSRGRSSRSGMPHIASRIPAENKPASAGQPSNTGAPGARVSATIRALSSADQRRRRAGSARISTRRNPPFASSRAESTTSRAAVKQGRQSYAYDFHNYCAGKASACRRQPVAADQILRRMISVDSP